MSSLQAWAKRHPILSSVGALFVFLHIASALYVAHTRPWAISPVQDQLEYKLLAEHLLTGSFSIASDTPNILRTPGYPLFLAGTYVVDTSGSLAILVQQLLLVFLAFLTYILLRRFKFSECAAFSLSLLLLVEPLAWLFSLQTMSDTLSAVLLLATALLVLTPMRSLFSRVFLTGLLAGATLLVKPSLLIALPFLVLILCREENGSWKRRTALVAVAVLTALVVTAPWLSRNAQLTGSPMLSSSATVNLGLGLGSREEQLRLQEGPVITDARGREANAYTSYTVAGLASAREIAGDVIAREGVLGLAERQVACAPRVWADHGYVMVGDILRGHTDPTTEPPIHLAESLLWYAVAALVLLGAAVGVCERRERLPFIAFAGMILAVTFLNVCIASGRTLITLYPFILLFAGIGIRVLFRRTDV